MPEKRRRYMLPAIVAALALTAVCGFAAFTVPSADDYMYASFLDGGLRGLMTRMAEHYRDFNGRVLVHAAAAVILHLGFWSFGVLCPLTVAAIPVLSALSEGRGRGCAVTVTAIFAAAFLSLPRKVLGWGVYWVAAFCNYALPTAMLCLLLYLGLRARNGARWAAALTPLLALLCGATTEQSGALAVALALYFAVKSLFTRRARLPSLISVFTAAAGLYTIFLSPATSSRAKTETGIASLSDLLRGLPAGLGRAAREFHTDGWFAPLMLAALFLLTALRFKRRGDRLLCACALASAALVLTGGLSSSWLLWTAVLTLAALAAAALIASKRETPGLLVLLGLASIAVMIPTTSIAGRTVMPFYLFILAAVSLLAAGEIEERPALASAVPAALFCLGLLTALPMARGFAQNYRVERLNAENARAARETGILNFCVDYDYRYTWTKMNASFSQDYLARQGLPADTEINWYAEIRPQVYVDGQKQYPAYRTTDGKVYFHLRVLEAFGGTIIPREGFSGFDHLTVTLPWMSADMDTDWTDRVAFSATDGRTCAARRTTVENRTWLPAEVYTGFFGLEIDYDEAGDAYFITAPESAGSG